MGSRLPILADVSKAAPIAQVRDWRDTRRKKGSDDAASVGGSPGGLVESVNTAPCGNPGGFSGSSRHRTRGLRAPADGPRAAGRRQQTRMVCGIVRFGRSNSGARDTRTALLECPCQWKTVPVPEMSSPYLVEPPRLPPLRRPPRAPIFALWWKRRAPKTPARTSDVARSARARIHGLAHCVVIGEHQNRPSGDRWRVVLCGSRQRGEGKHANPAHNRGVFGQRRVCPTRAHGHRRRRD